MIEYDCLEFEDPVELAKKERNLKLKACLKKMDDLKAAAIGKRPNPDIFVTILEMASLVAESISILHSPLFPNRFERKTQVGGLVPVNGDIVDSVIPVINEDCPMIQNIVINKGLFDE